jgi:hypothetical protein
MDPSVVSVANRISTLLFWPANRDFIPLFGQPRIYRLSDEPVNRNRSHECLVKIALLRRFFGRYGAIEPGHGELLIGIRSANARLRSAPIGELPSNQWAKREFECVGVERTEGGGERSRDVRPRLGATGAALIGPSKGNPRGAGHGTPIQARSAGIPAGSGCNAHAHRRRAVRRRGRQ